MNVAAAGPEPDGGPPSSPGLSGRQGVLVKDGKPYRGVGANYFDLFARLLHDRADGSSLANLAKLRAAGIPFVRFMACGFWPADWKLYRTDRPAYFARLDLVVREAERTGMGLIPSLFWHLPTLSDLAGEPLDRLGNSDSATRAFMRTYTEEVVTRYRASPAIWGWELGNEWNLFWDLPDAAKYRPAVWPTLGTPAERTARDEPRSPAVLSAMEDFARTVRRLDPHRIICTGHAVPRRSAWHNSHGRTWDPDTPEQYAEILRRDTPGPFDVVSLHVYPEASGEYPGGCRSPDELIALTQSIAGALGKPVLLGEFGAPATSARAYDDFLGLLRAVVTRDVPLAAFWVFDYARQDTDWNVTLENPRAGMIRAAADANPGERAEARPDDRVKAGPLSDPPARRSERLPLSDQADAGGWVPVEALWDEFAGDRLDKAKWWPRNPQWDGREPAWFDPAAVAVRDGFLNLTARVAEPPPALRARGYHSFTTAAMQSRTTVRYGYFEIRARPMRSRVSSAFWFYRNEPDRWTEIDVFEIGGAAKGLERTDHMNVHVFHTPESRTHRWTSAAWVAPVALAGGFHVYGLQWDPAMLAWFVDGVEVRRLPNTDCHQALTLNLDSETMPDWFGLPDPVELPATFTIDYVRAWSAAR